MPAIRVLFLLLRGWWRLIVTWKMNRTKSWWTEIKWTKMNRSKYPKLSRYAASYTLEWYLNIPYLFTYQLMNSNIHFRAKTYLSKMQVVRTFCFSYKHSSSTINYPAKLKQNPIFYFIRWIVLSSLRRVVRLSDLNVVGEKNIFLKAHHGDKGFCKWTIQAFFI